MISYFKTIGFLWLMIHSIVPASSQKQQAELKICITNIQTQKGQLVIDIYPDPDSYRRETPWQRHRIPKKDLSQMNCILRLKLPEGSYAIALFDDVNSDDKINRNFFGFPMEAFGFSMMDTLPMKKPAFDSICFNLSGEKQEIRINMQYW